MLKEDTYSPAPTLKPKTNRINMGDDVLKKASTYQAPKLKAQSSPNRFGGAAQQRSNTSKMPLAKTSKPKVPNPGNPYKSNIPKFDLGKVMAKKSPSQKPAPKLKPMNNFVAEAFKMLGGQAASKTSLTRQHGEKMIAARHGLPPHAAQEQKQDMYNVEVKAFDAMQKPNATLGDFFKSIGAMPDVEQKQEMRSTVQQGRINEARQQQFVKQQVEMGIAPDPQMKREAVKYKQTFTPEGNLRLEVMDDGNPYNQYAGQQYAQVDTGIISDGEYIETPEKTPQDLSYDSEDNQSDDTYQPSLDDLQQYAPERKWSEQDYERQQKQIRNATQQSSQTMNDFYARLPEAKDNNEFIAYDGNQMMHVKNGKVLRAWPAVSGAKGFQSKQHQKIKDKGPIPEGTWSLKQDDYQKYGDTSTLDRGLGLIGRGTWKGGTDSWGENRIWLSGPSGEKKPSKLGRSGFSIHGGAEPGSAGCIDATEFMADFTAYFKRAGNDLPLIVSYPD